MVSGLPPISGTEREVDLIYEGAKNRGIHAMKVHGDLLSVEDCLRHMEEFSSVHFACHGRQDEYDPMKSRFRFHHGQLDLDTISKRNLKNAELAFLSACETGRGEPRLADEAVHLAAGMLAAGYCRVVGTMWAIGDRHAPEIAKDFYDYLWNLRDGESGSEFDTRLSAHALHHATQTLRDNLDCSDMSLLAWVPYAHFGY